MAISFQCDCGRTLKAKDELAGRSVRCPACSSVMKVPAPEARIAEETEAGYALAEDPLPAANPARMAATSASASPSSSPQAERRSRPETRDSASRKRQGVATLPQEEGKSSLREYV